MSQKDGGQEKTTKRKSWWQAKIEELEAEVERLQNDLVNNEPNRTIAIERDRHKLHLGELEQKLARKEEEIIRISNAAAHLLQSSEDATRFLDDMTKSVSSQAHIAANESQIPLLLATLRRAQQQYRRAR